MSSDLNYGHLADTTISVAAHLEGELEEALAEHRLTRPSFLVLDALERAEGQKLNQRSWSRGCGGRPGRSRCGSGGWSERG